MVPFGDLMNHSQSNNIDFTYCEFSEALLMKSNQFIPKGFQLFNDYGKEKPNLNFLQSYGFLPHGNHNFTCFLEIFCKDDESNEKYMDAKNKIIDGLGGFVIVNKDINSQ